MANPIRNAIGYNQQGSVTAITPQPARPEQFHYALHTYGGGARNYPNGFLLTKLRWNSTNWDAYPTLLAKLGLSLTVTSAENTFSMDDDNNLLVYFNAVAQFNQDMRRRFFNEDLEIVLNRIELIAAP